MPLNRWLNGKEKAGYTGKTQGDGFNGTAGIIWAGVQMMISGR
jgi:hypothetical protein